MDAIAGLFRLFQPSVPPPLFQMECFLKKFSMEKTFSLFSIGKRRSRLAAGYSAFAVRVFQPRLTTFVAALLIPLWTKT